MPLNQPSIIAERNSPFSDSSQYISNPNSRVPQPFPLIPELSTAQLAQDNISSCDLSSLIFERQGSEEDRELSFITSSIARKSLGIADTDSAFTTPESISPPLNPHEQLFFELIEINPNHVCENWNTLKKMSLISEEVKQRALDYLIELNPPSLHFLISKIIDRSRDDNIDIQQRQRLKDTLLHIAHSNPKKCCKQILAKFNDFDEVDLSGLFSVEEQKEFLLYLSAHHLPLLDSCFFLFLSNEEKEKVWDYIKEHNLCDLSLNLHYLEKAQISESQKINLWSEVYKCFPENVSENILAINSFKFISKEDKQECWEDIIKSCPEVFKKNPFLIFLAPFDNPDISLNHFQTFFPTMQDYKNCTPYTMLDYFIPSDTKLEIWQTLLSKNKSLVYQNIYFFLMDQEISLDDKYAYCMELLEEKIENCQTKTSLEGILYYFACNPKNSNEIGPYFGVIFDKILEKHSDRFSLENFFALPISQKAEETTIKYLLEKDVNIILKNLLFIKNYFKSFNISDEIANNLKRLWGDSPWELSKGLFYIRDYVDTGLNTQQTESILSLGKYEFLFNAFFSSIKYGTQKELEAAVLDLHNHAQPLEHDPYIVSYNYYLDTPKDPHTTLEELLRFSNRYFNSSSADPQQLKLQHENKVSLIRSFLCLFPSYIFHNDKDRSCVDEILKIKHSKTRDDLLLSWAKLKLDMPNDYHQMLIDCFNYINTRNAHYLPKLFPLYKDLNNNEKEEFKVILKKLGNKQLDTPQCKQELLCFFNSLNKDLSKEAFGNDYRPFDIFKRFLKPLSEEQGSFNLKNTKDRESFVDGLSFFSFLVENKDYDRVTEPFYNAFHNFMITPSLKTPKADNSLAEVCYQLLLSPLQGFNSDKEGDFFKIFEEAGKGKVIVEHLKSFYPILRSKEIVTERLNKTFLEEKSRHPFLYVYYFLQHYKNSRQIKSFLLSVIRDDYLKLRYSGPHMQELEKLQGGLSYQWRSNPEYIRNGRKYEVVDNWEDMLCIGEEVGSCQKFRNDIELNVCLQGYLAEGMYKAMIIRDSQGKIVGRTILRLMMQPNNAGEMRPILMQEKLYLNKGFEAEVIHQEMRQCAKELASSLGVPLLNDTVEENVLVSLIEDNSKEIGYYDSLELASKPDYMDEGSPYSFFHFCPKKADTLP